MPSGRALGCAGLRKMLVGAGWGKIRGLSSGLSCRRACPQSNIIRLAVLLVCRSRNMTYLKEERATPGIAADSSWDGSQESSEDGYLDSYSGSSEVSSFIWPGIRSSALERSVCLRTAPLTLSAQFYLLDESTIATPELFPRRSFFILHML